MGDVVILALANYRSSRLRKGPPKGKWHVADLRGERPKGHPASIFCNKEGRVLIDRRQVWVELNSGVLWVVKNIHHAREGLFPNDVSLVHYRMHDRHPIVVREGEMRLRFEVWDSYASCRQGRVLR